MTGYSQDVGDIATSSRQNKRRGYGSRKGTTEAADKTKEVVKEIAIKPKMSVIKPKMVWSRLLTKQKIW